MTIAPIMPTQPPVNPPRRHRAVMVIHHNDHTVVDMATGERHALPAKEAWDLYEHLNIEV